MMSYQFTYVKNNTQRNCLPALVTLLNIVIIFLTSISVLLLINHAQAASVAGRVTAQGGDMISSMTVEIMDCYLDYQDSTSTDSNGDYIFQDLPAGHYLVKVSTCNSGYVPQYYQDAIHYCTATMIDLHEEQEVSEIDFTLKTGQSISGKVTHEDQDSAPSGVIVFACLEETIGTPFWPFFGEDSNNAFTFLMDDRATTNQNGDYVISGLPPGKYVVGTAPYQEENSGCLPYINSFFEDSYSPYSAKLIPVTETEGSSDIDIILKSGGDISGQVQDPNGKGMENITMSAFGIDTWMTELSGGTASSDPNGRYRIWGLPPGNYQVYPYSQFSYPLYDNNVQPLIVSVAKYISSPDCDFVLPATGKISGTVLSEADGTPVQGVSLDITPFNTFYGYGGYYSYGGSRFFTDVMGEYVLSGIGRGVYMIQANNNSYLRGPFNRFLNQVYDGSDRRTPVYVLPPDEVTGIDFYLTLGGSISGTIRKKTDGVPIPGILVKASPYYGNYGISYRVYPPTYSGPKFAYTDPQGRYKIEGLAQGLYLISIGTDQNTIYRMSYSSTFSPNNEYILSVSDGAVSPYYYYPYVQDPLQIIWVNPPEDTGEINFELVKGGIISGTVSDADTGQPIPSALVMVTTLSPFGIGYEYGYYPISNYSAKTDINGDYTIVGMQAGDYQVKVHDQKRLYTPSNYRVIEVAEGDVLTDQNFSLSLGGSISGQITDKNDGTGIPKIMVYTYPLSEEYKDIPYSDSNTINADTNDTDNDAINYGGYYGVYTGISYAYSGSAYGTAVPSGGYGVYGAVPYSAYGGYNSSLYGAYSGSAYGGYAYGGYGYYPYSPYYGYNGASVVTDENGQYTITGLTQGEYIINCYELWTEDQKGYTSEYYLDISSEAINEEALIELTNDLGSLGNIYPLLQIRYYRLFSPLAINLVLRDINGQDVPVLIRLTGDTSGEEGIYLGTEQCWWDDLNEDPISDLDKENSWYIYSLDLEGILNEYFSSSCYEGQGEASSDGLDSVISISLEGNGFIMDFLRLQTNDPDSETLYSYIDGFNYTDEPAAHGWTITSEKTPDVTMLNGNYLEGGGGMRLLACTPVSVNEGTVIGGKDMALSKISEGQGQISGQVKAPPEKGGHPLSGISIQLYRLDEESNYSYYGYYPYSGYYGGYYGGYMNSSSVTDDQGNYSIEGVEPGLYALLATDTSGSYGEQWYENIQQPVKGWYPGYENNTMPFLTKISKTNLTGFTYPNIEFMVKASLPFCLALDVITTSSPEPVKMLFYSLDRDVDWGAISCVSGAVLVHLSNSHEAYENQEERLWAKYQFDLNSILNDQLSTQLDHIEGITLKGCHYLIDYIKLTWEEDDQVMELMIDEFTFSGSPFDNGWVNHLPQSTGYAHVDDPELGHSCLMVTGVTPVSISEGEIIEGENFTITSGGGIQGMVTDGESGPPVPGIQIQVSEINASGSTYYGYPYAYPGSGWSPSAFTDANGRYGITGLLPGTYRVEAYDPEGYFENTVYEDIPLSSSSLPILSKNISTLNNINPDFKVEFMYRDKFAFRIDFEQYDGSNVGLIFQTDDDDSYDWPDEIDTNISPSIFSIEMDDDTGYYDEYGEPPDKNQWVSFKFSDIYSQFGMLLPSINPIKAGKIYLAGSDYKVASIKFIGEGEADQVVDDFNYTDSVENHGWVIVRPEINNFRMIEDPVLGKTVLECLAAKPVTLAEGETASGIDFHLRKGNKITGQVTDAESGAPLMGISIRAYTENGYIYSPYYGFAQAQESTYTDQTGCYTLSIPPSGSTTPCRIMALDDAYRLYLEAFYPDELELTAGQEITDINFALEKGASLAGRIIFADTNIAAEGARIYCRACDPNLGDGGEYFPGYYGAYYGTSYNSYGTYYGYDSSYQTFFSRSDSDGCYQFTRLSKGGYVIYALSSDYNYLGFYQDNSDYSDPPVILEPGQTLEGIDIVLKPRLQENTYSVPYQETGSQQLSTSIGYGGYSNYGSSALWAPSVGSYGYSNTYSGYYAGTAYSQNYGYGGYGSNYNQSSQDAPSILSEPTLEAFVDMPYTYQILIQDPNRWDDLDCRLINAPAGMTMGQNTWLITWTPSLDQVGFNMVTVGADAAEGGIARQSFSIQVFPYVIIESAEGPDSPLLNGEWENVQGVGVFSDTNDADLDSRVLMAQTEEQGPLNFRIRYPGQGASDLQNVRSYLSFAIRDDNDFQFRVSVSAGGQDYILSYVPSDGNCTVSGQTIYHPVGTKYKNGQWHLCKRNLRKDLDIVGKASEFEWVNYFEIWGDCRLDDLWLSYHPIDYLILPIKLYKGLNLINLPVKPEGMDSQVLTQLLTNSKSETINLRRRNTYKQQWEGSFNPVREDQGFVLFSPQEKWITFKGTAKELGPDVLASSLKRGLNLVSSPTISEDHYYGTDLMNDLRLFNRKIQGLHTHNLKKGTWSSKVNFFNHLAGPRFKIDQGKGYIVHISQ